jgi:hypothetical protein
MLQKQKDILELCAKYKLPLHIKVHPSGEKENFAHFKYLAKNYPNVKIIGGYWKWFLKAERLIPHYQLVILDIIRTRLITVMAQSHIPCIIYTKRTNLIKKWDLEKLNKIFYIAKSKEELEKLLYKFSFGELYLPENEQLMKKWFEKRETIEKWYKVGLKNFILRRKFRHEWKTDANYYVNIPKLLKRVKRIFNPPQKDTK